VPREPFISSVFIPLKNFKGTSGDNEDGYEEQGSSNRGTCVRARNLPAAAWGQSVGAVIASGPSLAGLGSGPDSGVEVTGELYSKGTETPSNVTKTHGWVDAVATVPTSGSELASKP
jgi:hypothetical protein